MSEEARLDPSQVFFISGNACSDGSLDLSWETPQAGSYKDVLTWAKETVAEHGGEMYVIECRCVKRVAQGKPRVFSL